MNMSIINNHDIVNVKLRLILCVKSAGLRDHIGDNQKVFSFQLDDDDKQRIQQIQQKSKDLMNIFGDCGGEYRRS